jgi:hypothetical protein
MSIIDQHEQLHAMKLQLQVAGMISAGVPWLPACLNLLHLSHTHVQGGARQAAAPSSCIQATLLLCGLC